MSRDAKAKTEGKKEKMPRLTADCPMELYLEYKAILARKGVTIKEDIIEHVRKTVEGKK